MGTQDKTNPPKQGFMSKIWESMNKTGGCCGSGENCCGPAKPSGKKAEEEKKTAASKPGERDESK